MTPNVKENKAFVNCFRDSIAVIQQKHAPVECTLPENIASTDEKEHSGAVRLFGPKLRAASRGFGA
jgi:hypothetical protein